MYIQIYCSHPKFISQDRISNALAQLEQRTPGATGMIADPSKKESSSASIRRSTSSHYDESAGLIFEAGSSEANGMALVYNEGSGYIDDDGPQV